MISRSTLVRSAVVVLSLLVTACMEEPKPAGGGGQPSEVVAGGPAPVAGSEPLGQEAIEAPQPVGPLTFTDVTTQSGIRFQHNSGAFGKKYMPETMGSGCAFLDVNNDGWQDILLINSTAWPEKKNGKSLPALYVNNQNGTFTDRAEASGLGVDLYGLGCAIADYDNDGNQDIYITAVGPNKLFRNTGSGTFVDVTSKAGVGDPGFSTSALWFDFDRDGNLDLFVCNYVEWSVATDKFCALDGTNKSYCTPEAYKGESPTLYHNRGDGTFEDVTKKAGLFDPDCKALGVAMIDYDQNGWMDLFVANDTQPNRLFKNNGNGSFSDVAIEAGVAFSDQGTPRAGMGVDAADFDGSGRPGLVLGNFSNEMMSLYRNEGSGLFLDDDVASVVRKTSALSVTFACFFFDYDNDGFLDIFASNGHVADDIAKVQPNLKYAQPAHLFRNKGKGQFEETGSKMDPIRQSVIGRGAAYGDFDHDGDLDLLVMANNGPARLLRNDGGNQNNALRISLQGVRNNRSGVGAVITLKTSDGAVLRRVVKTGSSYCSQSEQPITFGLGKATSATNIQIVWPDGTAESLPEIAGNQALVIEEGRGVVRAEPIKGPI